MTSGPDDHRAAARYQLNMGVEGSVGDQRFEGRLQDISATGAAVVGVPDTGFDNSTFVELHVHGMGTQTGTVARKIPEGFALQFDSEEEATERQKQIEAMASAMGPNGLLG